LLVAYCRSVGSPVGGKEYFRGIDFESAVKYANAIDLNHKALASQTDSGVLDRMRERMERGHRDSACLLAFGVGTAAAQEAIDAIKTMTWGEAKELVRRRRERDHLRELQDFRFLQARLELDGVGRIEVTR
jgi:hypothetical protein